MKTRIIRIGNSKGIRIPKPLLAQTGIEDEVEIEVKDNRLVVSRVTGTRQGWSEAFKRMAERGDDLLLDADTIPASRWDEEEWEWQ
jgi:antitoxin MazE